MTAVDGTIPDTKATHLDVEGESRLYQHLSHFWHPVAFSSDVTEDKPVQGEIMGERLVVCRLDGKVTVLRDLCRHRGASLALGYIDGDCIRCSYHGWSYDSTGRVQDIPARPELSGKLQVSVERYPAAESGGLIWACLDPEPKFSLPEFPVLEEESYSHLFYDSYEWKCSMARRLENYFDFSHFAFVHDGILGDSEDAEIADYDVKRVGSEVRINAGPFIEFTDNVKNEALAGSVGATYEAWKRYRVFMPNTMLLHSSAGPSGEDYVLFVAVAPLAPKVVRCFTIQSRNYALDKDQEFRDLQAVILGQDQPVVESQRPEELPDDLSAEMHVRGADAGTLEYRRWLIEISNGRYEMAAAEADNDRR
jgi:phenylpropionate dioxygenase-like ring-hydroxylating dioxygenase large terminal subunit